MITLTPEEARNALGIADFYAAVTSVSTDSRAVSGGELFVALRGERFDGHEYVADVLSRGAAGALVDSRWWNDGGPHALFGLPEQLRSMVHVVPDTLAALGALATAVRTKSGAVVVGITGSVGKTGTKDMLKTMAAEVGPTIATTANHNNEIGVPLTLLSIEPDTALAVVEMGMRGLGQIASLAEIARPDVGLITNIHPVHLELLGSLESVAKAKAELVRGLRPGGWAVVPYRCEALEPYLPSEGVSVLRFGLGAGAEAADVWGEVERVAGRDSALLRLSWPAGEAEMEVPFTSRARLENAVAAAAACFAAGLPLARCLPGLQNPGFTPSRGDLEQIGEWLVINDTYNASPAAVRAAIDELTRIARERGGRAIAVLGDMLELGVEAAAYHEQAGAYAAEKGVEVLVGVGPLSTATAQGFTSASSSGWAGHVRDSGDSALLLNALRPGDVVLLKASRSMRLEVMVDRLRQAAARVAAAQETRGEGDES